MPHTGNESGHEAVLNGSYTPGLNGLLAHSLANGRDDEEEDDEAVEHDPTGRYSRFKHSVGHGRFKQVFKGFDERQGIDVAWSKVQQESNHLDDDQMHRIVGEMSIGLELDHPNIIKCYRCWEDEDTHCINLVTEYFTSGNLRDYRQKHKLVDYRAVRKWARQILTGLAYLHFKEPPIIHGDLRCDKIYINGHSGEIKIGDLGLATLLPRRFNPATLPEGVNTENQYSKAVDIFAFGLCVLELSIKRKVDSSNAASWPEMLEDVEDEEAKAFLLRCLAPAETRPTATELLQDPFLMRRTAVPEPRRQSDLETTDSRSLSREVSGREERGEKSDADGSSGVCQAGELSGEDYRFKFTCQQRDGGKKLDFRLQMEYQGDEDDEAPGEEHPRRTIDFTYDIDEDTPDAIAAEIGEQFSLSDADRDICAAALKEWLASNSMCADFSNLPQK
eukprot:jgi/Botrbrau1/15421/Bobra.43_2s0047.1